MGMTLYVALDRSIEGIEINNDRVFLSSIVGPHEKMDELCNKLGVPSLSGFQSYDPQEIARFIDDPNERKALIEKMEREEPIQWFDPGVALPAVRALQQHFAVARFMSGRRNPQDRTEDLLNELRDLEAVLRAAARAGARFRLHIGE
jgi:hypothetical protein